MYDQTYFRGKSVEITGNVSDFKTIKFDNLIASVKIEGNCCWKLFADKNFQGASIKLKIGEYQSATNIIDVFKKASAVKNSCWEKTLFEFPIKTNLSTMDSQIVAALQKNFSIELWYFYYGKNI